MRLYIPLVMPRLLYAMGALSPLGAGGIGNITLAPFIISEKEMSKSTETHEAIHVMQQYECGIIGGAFSATFLLILGASWLQILSAIIAGFLPGMGWFYILYYLTDFYWLYVIRNSDEKKYNAPDGVMAYYLIPFEREAYLYDQNGLEYLKKRKSLAWLHIADDEIEMNTDEFSALLYEKYKSGHILGNIITKKKL